MAAERYLRFETSRPSSGRPFLWPVYVWKVMYPTKRVVKINLFQQAILGLSRARCQDSHDMAEFLGLDRELIAFIISTQLIPNGWMTNLGTLTPKGEKVLEETEEASEEVRMGYAYQDAISGNWIPRFTEDLPEIEPSRSDDHGYPIFLRNLDSGKEDRPFRLGHLNEDPLDLNALFDAYERYRIDYEHAKQRDEGNHLQSRLRIESLSFVEENAQPMWLWTRIFPDTAGVQHWLVADPFGLQQAASWLRKPLKDILPKNERAARYIDNILGEIRTDEMSAGDWLLSLENQIDLTLLTDFAWSRKVSLIEDYLASVLRRTKFLSGQERPLQEDVSSLLIETHNLAESILQWLCRVFPPNPRRLPHWKDQKDWKNGEAMNCLQLLNLSCLTDDVMKRLAQQRLDQVRTAVKQGSSSLKALIFASLLATVEQRRHPFFSLSNDELQLNRLLDMADARNKKAGHSGEEKSTKAEAIDYAEFILEWTQIFKEWY